MSAREWIWRGQALSQARGAVRELPNETRLQLERARLASELAGRLLDPVDPLRAPAGSLALSVLREAAYWALLAQSPGGAAAPTLAQAFANTSHDVLQYAAGSEAELAQVKVALLDKTFVASANDDLQTIERDARIAQAFVRALVQRQAEPEARLRGVLVQRWLRTVLGALALCAVVLGAKLAVAHLNAMPDLALGRPWHASSKYTECEPQNMRCDGKRTAIFFHTLEEDNPWVEIDLGAPRAFSAFEVDNREDCCPDRASPLIFEISNDQKKWKPVARRDDPFRTMRVEIKPVTARYVRLRVPRRVAFHLVRVSVYEH